MGHATKAPPARHTPANGPGLARSLGKPADKLHYRPDNPRDRRLHKTVKKTVSKGLTGVNAAFMFRAPWAAGRGTGDILVDPFGTKRCHGHLIETLEHDRPICGPVLCTRAALAFHGAEQAAFLR